MLVFIVMYATWVHQFYQKFDRWQDETQNIAAIVGIGQQPIYIFGSYEMIPGKEIAGIQKSRGLELRLKYLTNRPVFICDEVPQECTVTSDTKNSDRDVASITVKQFTYGTEVWLPARIDDN